MSLFISTSKPATRDDLRRVIILAVALGLCLGGVAGFNAYVDPYGRFGPSSILSADGSMGDFPLLAMLEVGKLPRTDLAKVDTVIIGDSRGRQLTKPLLKQDQERTILNLSIGGASYEESVAFFRKEMPKLPKLRTLVITVPFERLAAKPRINRCTEAQPVADSLLKYLLTEKITRDSYSVFAHRRLAPPKPPTALSGQSAPLKNPAQEQITRSTWRSMYQSYQPQRAEMRIAELKLLARELQAAGTQVIFWCPPLREEILSQIEECNVETERKRLVVSLKEAAPVADLTRETSIGGVPFTFSDPVHSMQGPLILDSLLSKLSETSKP